MDRLAYLYNRRSNGWLLNNQLQYIKDTVATSTYAGDLTTQAAGNYTYNKIGNLTKDVTAAITNIDWSVYGKIQTIYKGTGNLIYTYDANGHRVSKTLGASTTWYVRDAQGNALGVYDNSNSTITWKEQQLYGSSRLGLWTPNLNVGTGNTSTPNTEYGIAGRKYYELNNHLGNVVTTISDKRLQPATNITPLLLPDVITAQDYYPFGMLQPGRQYTAGVNYRYGFNGKENDNEVKGTGNEQDYGMRIYDPRGGRFLSVDPITSSYPMLTPYQFASNRPIDGTDIDGKEYGTIHVDLYPKGGGTSDRYYTPYDYGQRNTYGPQGPGVNYDIVVHMQSANGYIKVYDDGPIFLPRTATQYGLPTDYGNYYGGTTLFRVLKTGIIDYGNATKPSYTAQPVDAVDYGAMLHDKGYDLLHAVGANSLFNDWGTTPVDERALSGWLAIIRNFKVGDKDPYLIEQTITKAEMGAADRGATLFQLIINSKKSKISDFVKKNVSGARSGGSHNDTEYNYQLFLKTYIGKDAKGNYIRIEKMWKKDEKGNYIPKPSGN